MSLIPEYGFTPLGSYESYLEEALPDSELSNEIIERFEKINQLHCKFEDHSIIYDSLLEELDNSDPRYIIKSIYPKLLGISDIPHITDIESIEDREIEEIKNWINSKCEIASKISEDDTLPDTLNFGESIIIKGVDNSELSFTIDEIEISPTEGSEEIIDIYLCNSKGERISGYIKLIVGYLNFDEDGGASDGIEEDIDDYLSQEDDLIAFNHRVIKEVSEKIVNGETDSLTLMSTMWPLVIGKDEAEQFILNPHLFSSWMHELQRHDYYYAKPQFFKTDQGIKGIYALTEDCPTLLPNKPWVPVGYQNPETGEKLECNYYEIALYSTTEEKSLGTIPFERIFTLGPDYINYYDGNTVLVNNLPLEVMKRLEHSLD